MSFTFLCLDSFYADVLIYSRCEWVFVGRDDSKSTLVIATKAEMAEANRFHLLSREVVDFFNV